MSQFNFDMPVERRRTRSFKWDANERMFGRADLLPFWVADMDFATPEPILRAIRSRLVHPVLGYEERPVAYVDAVRSWLDRRHGWDVPREWLMFCPPSTITGMYGLIMNLTAPGDGIVVPTPTYGPLIGLVAKTERRLIRNPLVEVDGRFRLDVDGLERAIDDGTRMLILCSPHNPTGRVFTREELEAVDALASDNKLVVLSDEVHADLVRPGGRHLPFGSLAKARSVTVVSPNKPFNTAGLPQATLVIPDPELRAVFQRFLDTTQLNHDHTFGGVAMMAAYNDCEHWLAAVLDYIDGNHRRVAEFLRDEVPGVGVHEAEATYLAWLDYRQLGLSEEEALERLTGRGGVALYGGSWFGDEGRGFLRMNVACPRQTLEEGLAGVRRALAD